MSKFVVPVVLAMVLFAYAATAAEQNKNGVVTGDGAWSYFGDPRAVHTKGTTFVGWVTSRGYVEVASLKNGRVTRRTLAFIGRDDHSSPSLFVRKDDRIVAMYAPHGRGPRHRWDRMFYRITTRPRDIRVWGPVREMPANSRALAGHTDRGFSYPNPVQMPGRQVWVFWRGASWWPTLSITKNWRHWARPRHVIRSEPGQRPYLKVAGDGRNAYLAFTPGHPRSMKNGVHFLRISGSGQQMRADGKKVGSLDDPVTYRQADLVYRYKKSTGRAWVMDVAVGPDGRPVVLYFRRDPKLKDNLYVYARWDGHRWRNYPIVKAGRAPSYYVGGATLDHEDPSVVYLSRKVRKKVPMEVEIWSTPDHGASWSHLPVTQNSRTDNWRPVSPRGATELLVFWFSGRYTNFRQFKTKVIRELKEKAK